MTQQYQPAGHSYGDVVMPQRPTMPPQNTGWAVAAMLFFWPLAFSAFSHSAKVFPLWSTGDYEGAQRASDQAKKLGKISLLIWAIFIVAVIVFYGVIFAAVLSNMDSFESTTYPTYR